MSRIIRHSTQQLNTKTIKVKSFSFLDELGTEDSIAFQADQSIVNDQLKLREELQQEVQQTRHELEQQRKELQQEIQAARESWLQEKEQLMQQAYEEGFSKGYEDGQMKIHEDLRVKIEKTNDTVNAAIVNGQSYLASQEHVILDLAIESAKRIVGRSLSEDSSVYIDIIKRALVEARDAEFIKIYTSSEYYTEVTNKRNELETLLPPNLLFTVFMDENLQGAESYLESNHGRMIISMDSQLNELKKGLIEIMESVD